MKWEIIVWLNNDEKFAFYFSNDEDMTSFVDWVKENYDIAGIGMIELPDQSLEETKTDFVELFNYFNEDTK